LRIVRKVEHLRNAIPYRFAVEFLRDWPGSSEHRRSAVQSLDGLLELVSIYFDCHRGAE